MIEPKYLLKCSRNALRGIQLSELSKANNKRKEVREELDKWIELEATTLAIEWLVAYGEELTLLLSEPPAEEIAQLESKPPLARSVRYEFWRSAQRHAKRRAG